MDVLVILLCTLAGLVLGAALGVWIAWRRFSENPEERATAEQLRTELAEARTRSEMLDRALTQEQSRARQDSDVLRELNPLSQQIKDLGHHVRVLERDRQHQYGQLAQQLKTASDTDSALLRNTQALVATLRANSARGHWGEVQLRRIVEAAGMLRHTDFTEQAHLRGDDGALRPDLLVYLPGEKTLAVDAKAPLAAVLAAEELAQAPDAAERRRELMTEHAKAVRAHVDQLAKKQYWSALEHSPELVVCFLPAESYLAAALEADPQLLDDAFGKNVALVSPVSLLAALKSVAYSWQQENLVDNAKLIVDSSRQLYQRLATVGTHLTAMGNSLRKSVDSYNTLVGSVESRLLPTARRLNELDSTLTAQEPSRPIDSAPRSLSASELLE
ncbi:DNA recombination protein RmuC [Citricoccus muralis]|uniref:DNA recombination protein RmuC n=1 Tax=Citricoccus muralis TaxID=169134 RepID=A0ABY8H3W0_9MICC|nr:DNA recombination protein RmuC [Citricoccus muralis]WFP15765.1 DNA recombination protein RmuC [Citricoccus muralis]